MTSVALVPTPDETVASYFCAAFPSLSRLQLLPPPPPLQPYPLSLLASQPPRLLQTLVHLDEVPLIAGTTLLLLSLPRLEYVTVFVPATATAATGAGDGASTRRCGCSRGAGAISETSRILRCNGQESLQAVRAGPAQRRRGGGGGRPAASVGSQAALRARVPLRSVPGAAQALCVGARTAL